MVKFNESRVDNKHSGGPHPDYYYNLKFAERFCSEMQGRLVTGVRMEVTDSQWIKKCILMISWKPPEHVKTGNYANPVTLHQSSSACQKEAQETLKTVQKTANLFLETRHTNKSDQLKFDAFKA